MYKDVINYKLAEWVTQEHLMKVAKEVYDSWMSQQKWFVSRDIHTDEDGEYFDIVTRDSKASADKSNADMANVPHADARFGCYEMTSINSKGITVQGSFGE